MRIKSAQKSSARRNRIATTYCFHIAFFVLNVLFLLASLVGLAAELSHIAGYSVQVPIAGGNVTHGPLAAFCLATALLMLGLLFRISYARTTKWARAYNQGITPADTSPSGKILIATMVSIIAACWSYWLPASTTTTIGSLLIMAGFVVALIMISLHHAKRKEREAV